MRGLTHRWLARTVPADIRRPHGADRRVGHVVGTARAEAAATKKNPGTEIGAKLGRESLSIEP